MGMDKKNLQFHEEIKDIIFELRNALIKQKHIMANYPKNKPYKIHYHVIELLINAAIISNEALNGFVTELEKEENEVKLLLQNLKD